MKEFLAAAFVCSIFVGGCASPGTGPLVVGERILVKKAGEEMVFPEPKSPASVWYVVDDVGVEQWLDLTFPEASASASASSTAARQTGTFDESIRLTPRFGAPSRVASVMVKLEEAGTGELILVAGSAGSEYTRMKAELADASAIVLIPEELWFHVGDSLSITNTTGVSATCVVDFIR